MFDYDYDFFLRKRKADLEDTPLVVQWTVIKTLTLQEQLTLTNQEFMALFNHNTLNRNFDLDQHCVQNVLDFDDATIHTISIRRVEDNCHAFDSQGWVQNFANRRNLRPGHVVGLFFDQESERLFFSVLSDPPPAPNWTFTKRLTQHDLQELTILNGEVQELFGPHIRPDIANLELKEGCFLDVLDFDKGTMHKITLGRVAGQWHAFCVEWVPHFVSRRALNAGNVVGFFWLHGSNMLVFSVLD